MNKIIALWAHPRSMSTAFERMIIERNDMTVLHEPFSFHYYVSQQHAPGPHYDTGVNYPSHYSEVARYILDMARINPVYFKDISYHGYENLICDEDFLSLITHTFIIRNPARTIASHFAVNPALSVGEIGYWHQYMLFQRVSLPGTPPPAVIDADDLISDPAGICKAYCQSIGIPFVPEALHWQSGDQQAWSVWKDWHVNAASSTTFASINTPYQETIENNDLLRSYYDYHLPFYLELYHRRLRPVAV